MNLQPVAEDLYHLLRDSGMEPDSYFAYIEPFALEGTAVVERELFNLFSR